MKYIAAATLYLSVVAFGQAQNHGDAAQAVFDIDINSSRPLAEIADQLEARLGIVVNYEDPAYVSSSDTQDIARELARDNCYNATPPCRFLIPKRSRVRVSIPVGGGKSSPAVALETAVNAHNNNHNTGVFTVYSGTDSYTIVGTHVTGADGSLVESSSPLDVPVTFPAAERTACEIISLVCEQISKTGPSVQLASGPPNLLAQTEANIGADNEPARTVLLRAFAALQWSDPHLRGLLPRRRLAWSLFWEANTHFYAMNIQIPMKEQPHPAGSTSLVYQVWADKPAERPAENGEAPAEGSGK